MPPPPRPFGPFARRPDPTMSPVSRSVTILPMESPTALMIRMSAGIPGFGDSTFTRVLQANGISVFISNGFVGTGPDGVPVGITVPLGGECSETSVLIYYPWVAGKVIYYTDAMIRAGAGT